MRGRPQAKSRPFGSAFLRALGRALRLLLPSGLGGRHGCRSSLGSRRRLCGGGRGGRSPRECNLTAKLADLDVLQRTAIAWEQYRLRHNVTPLVRVEAFANATQALQLATRQDLLILDTPGQIADDTAEVARRSHFIVQPTSPSADDLPLSLLVFEALERMGIPRDKLAFALCRVLSRAEEKICPVAPRKRRISRSRGRYLRAPQIPRGHEDGAVHWRDGEKVARRSR